MAHMDSGLDNGQLYADLENEEMEIAYPAALFDRSIEHARPTRSSRARSRSRLLHVRRARVPTLSTRPCRGLQPGGWGPRPPIDLRAVRPPYGDVTVVDGVIDYAKKDGELTGAFLLGPDAVRQGHAAASSLAAGGRGLP